MQVEIDAAPGAVSREQLTTLIHAFYRDIRTDESLAPIFARVIGDDWSAHLDRMVEFWCTVMLGSRSFRGNVFGKHMAIDGVAPAHFVRWLSLWRAHTALEVDPPAAEELQRIAQGIARNLYLGLFGRPPAPSELAPERSSEMNSTAAPASMGN